MRNERQGDRDLMVMTSMWLHDESSRDFEVKQTGHIGFGANDRK